MTDKKDKRLSWEDTYREMAHEREDWSDLDTAVGDGFGRRVDRLGAAHAAQLRRLVTEMYGE